MDIRGERHGRRTRVDLPLTGSARDTPAALPSSSVNRLAVDDVVVTSDVGSPVAWAARPCPSSSRKPVSHSAPGACPQASDATVKTAVPSMNSRL